jgi:hypothetical protein
MEALHGGKATLGDLIVARNSTSPEPPGFFLYVDQGEELYVRVEQRQRQRFSEILAHALPDSRLRMMMSMRSDFFGDGFDEPRGLPAESPSEPQRPALARTTPPRPASTRLCGAETPYWEKAVSQGFSESLPQFWLIMPHHSLVVGRGRWG